jgi:transcriptional regulator with XRE-family HTH domain
VSESLESIIRSAIRGERTRQGMTQQELGDRLGVSRQVIWTMENGPRAVTLAETPALCEALGITLDRLLIDAPAGARRALGLTVLSHRN